MPWNNLPTKIPGDPVTAEQWNTIANNFQELTPPAAGLALMSTGPQSFVWRPTALAILRRATELPSLGDDNIAAWDWSTAYGMTIANNQIHIPANGVYRISYDLRVFFANDAYSGMRIRVDGEELYHLWRDIGSSQWVEFIGSRLRYLSAGSVLDLYAYGTYMEEFAAGSTLCVEWLG